MLPRLPSLLNRLARLKDQLGHQGDPLGHPEDQLGHPEDQLAHPAASRRSACATPQISLRIPSIPQISLRNPQIRRVVTLDARLRGLPHSEVTAAFWQQVMTIQDLIQNKSLLRQAAGFI